jgi:endonuclease III
VVPRGVPGRFTDGRTMKSRATAARILGALAAQHPNADTELNFRNPFELLVATVLSAQTTDIGVNAVTPALFGRFPDAKALAAADPTDVEVLVKSTGFFRQKARSIIGLSQALVDAHGGAVPPRMDALVELPGVGRKTANVVLAHALDVPGLPVDRHVLRVSNRIGLAHSEDPEVVEEQLGALYPPGDWRLVSDTLILHGRRVCNPKPLCDRCSVRRDCDAYRSGVVTPVVTGETRVPPKRTAVPPKKATTGGLARRSRQAKAGTPLLPKKKQSAARKRR